MGYKKIRRTSGGFQQNHGVSGVVYILTNSGLREGWVKIGCTRRSGAARAMDLNLDANTGTPGAFQCIFERRTKDCGRAEQRVFAKLASQRRGKRGQEFFEISIAQAKQAIEAICDEVDKEILALTERNAVEAPKRTTIASEAIRPVSSRSDHVGEPPRQSGARSPQYGSASGVHTRTDTPPVPATKPRFGRSIWGIVIVGILIWLFNNSEKQPTSPQAPDRDVATAKTSNGEVGRTSSPSDVGAASSSYTSNSEIPSVTRFDHKINPNALANASNNANVSLANEQVLAQTGSPDNSASTPMGFEQAGSEPDLNRHVTRDGAHQVQSACDPLRPSNDSSAYGNKCLATQPATLSPPEATDLSAVSADDQQSIQSVCGSRRLYAGPAAYNECVASQ
ncbi:GIY-YIG nuclease family protein, partial [Burkholderia sp. BKH01]|uniref:GIY-YIG nuclease family protein n=1 Tax=Burkholderia sp. BKH01 TaxID=2769262 RepID=UPI00398BF2AC